MLLNSAHNCSFCSYTTNRPYNLKRHIQTRHKTSENDRLIFSRFDPKTSRFDPKTSRFDPKTSRFDPKKSSLTSCSEENVPKCVKCGKNFTKTNNLTVHLETCDGTPKGCCKFCKEPFPNKDVLYRHRKLCQQLQLIEHNQTYNNSQVADNITNVTINIGTMNVLTYPKDGEHNFDFSTENITKTIMKKVVTLHPEAGFKRFMGAIFENPVNRCILKTNPNVSYSKIHIGNGEWELANDYEVLPEMTHHMTTAAFSKLEEFEKSLVLICDKFKKHVQTVNEDDETEEYKRTIQNLKMIIINMSRKIEDAQRNSINII